MTTATMIELRYAWLQKHPSPAATRGEFHWYPPDRDRELRASFVERSRGVDAPAVLWQLAPGRVSWARVFAATAPLDGRRYVGLVLSTAEAEAASALELLDALRVPAAEPWSEASGASEARSVPAAVPRLRVRARRGPAAEVDGVAALDGTPDVTAPGGAADVAAPGGAAADVTAIAAAAEVAAIARSLLSGGDAVLAEPERPDLPRLVASVERWMAPAVAGRPRRGAWRRGVSPQTPDPVAGLLAAAWSDPGSRAARAWTLLCELAQVQARTLDELAAELAAAEQPAAALTDAERAVLGEARDFAGTLHAWGRGRLDGVAGAATLPTRLADALALRVLACLMADRDPRGPIAEARWHALLPAARRAVLLDMVAQRAASLRALVEVPHA
ncbi:MAG TPA: hypothetical protein VNO30_25735 [Kofleriaceae bacterium]|nr:hypothetical protein [Kofleriaceae bacterium]